MNLLITICARGGSKGIPGKNIKPVNGIPLIGYTIHQAQLYAKRSEADIALSTDDQRIKDTAAHFGFTTDYLRPAELANDTAGKVPVLHHVLDYHEMKTRKRYDYVLDLDVTSPLRTMEDLDEAFALLEAKPDALNIFSVNFPKHNPYSDMVEEDAHGYFQLCKTTGQAFLSRQTSPKVYELNASYYFFRRAFFETGNATQLTSRSLIHQTKHMCFELDDPIEFELLDYLITNKKLDFTLP
jgi:CMP-N-acetylneuraminic acid synthetase